MGPFFDFFLSTSAEQVPNIDTVSFRISKQAKNSQPTGIKMIKNSNQEKRYAKRKARARERSRETANAFREISFDVPPTPHRVDNVADNDPFFEESYGIVPPLAAKIIQAALSGRYGRVLLTSRTKAAAVAALLLVRNQLEQNDKLATFFPAVCYPIRRLEGIPQRRLLWHGVPTGTILNRDAIRLPVMPPSPAAGVWIVAAKRGQASNLPDDRPTFLIDVDQEK